MLETSLLRRLVPVRPRFPRLIISFAKLRLRSAGLVAVASLAATAVGQDINTTVAPNQNASNNSVDIHNTSGTNWLFYSAPTPAGTSMARVDDTQISVSPWPTAGLFQPDPNKSLNRIYPGEFLRVYAGNAPVNTVIQIPFTYGPLGTQYHFNVTVTQGAQVVSINYLDDNPTAASTVRWGVTFDQGISGVTANNFALTPTGLMNPYIMSVTADDPQPSTNWTVTVNTGTGNGYMGLDWVGTSTESPPVPNQFVGPSYDFTPLPIVTQNPSSAGINRNTTVTLQAAATSRGGAAAIDCQWYQGDPRDAADAVKIPSATSTSYTPPSFTDIGTFSYYCEFSFPGSGAGYIRDTIPAVITVVDPPHVNSGPNSLPVASGGSAGLSVSSSGTSLSYQWYGGLPPDTSNPVGVNSLNFTTPTLYANTNYWVRVSNPGPTISDSPAATVTIIPTLAADGHTTFSGVVNTTFSNSFVVVALDSANNPAAGVPVTFNAPTGPGPTATFSNNASSTVVYTGPDGTASVPITANQLSGVYPITASFAPLQVTATATNLGMITTPNNAIFFTGISNSFSATEVGLTNVTFNYIGTLPPGVSGHASGLLSGTPTIDAAGVYPLTIRAINGFAPQVRQPFTLTVLDEAPYVAHPTFNTNGLFWRVNTNGIGLDTPYFTNNILFLTYLTYGEIRSAWFDSPLYIDGFQASFTYQLSAGNADGAAFVLQNDPRGPAAYGVGAGGLGYSGLTPSAGLLLNIFAGSPGGRGILFATNGVGVLDGNGHPTGSSFVPMPNLSPGSGYPLYVSLLYSNHILQCSFADEFNYHFVTNYPVDLPALLGGDSAWVGFTAACGNFISLQLISDFSFTPLPSASLRRSSNNATMLTWPSAAAGFQVLYKTNLNDTTWSPLNATIVQSNGQNQVVLPPGTKSGFYRLVLPPN